MSIVGVSTYPSIRTFRQRQCRSPQRPGNGGCEAWICVASTWALSWKTHSFLLHSPVQEPRFRQATEDAGAGALVMHSLFQEEIEANRAVDRDNIGAGDIFGGTRALATREEYLEQFKQLRAALGIPVIPSLNGSSRGDWVAFAAELEAAGAPALELNVYYIAADITEPADAVEQRVLDIFRAVAERVSVPIGVKLSPYFSSVGKLVTTLEASGAAGVSLFNRFYQPNIDLETLSITDSLELSSRPMPCSPCAGSLSCTVALRCRWPLPGHPLCRRCAQNAGVWRRCNPPRQHLAGQRPQPAEPNPE